MTGVQTCALPIYRHSFLLDLLNIQQIEFITHREKLEALGLLETYQKNENEYLYIIKVPFTPKQFFKDTFLGSYLQSEVGEVNFEYLVKIFKVNKPVLNHLDNLSKSFEDLYEFSATKLLNLSEDFEGRNGVNTTLIKRTIDYDKFVDLLPRALKSSNLLNENYKQSLLQLASVYQYDINQMIEVYTNASRGKKDVTIEQLNLQAKLYYEKQNKDLIVTTKEVDENSELSMINFTTIVDKFVVEDPLQKSMALDTINTFISQNEIEQGVLNVLLIFILKNKEGILPHVNYLNVVWNSWSKNGVQSVEDAINYRNTIESNWSNKNSSKQYSNSKQVKKPDWLGEYMDEISKMEE